MRFRRAVASSAALAAGLLIAACAGKTDTVCRADIALDRRFGLLVTPVTIEGTEVPGVLDTGAENSAVTGGLVTRLGLRGDEKNGSLLSGVGGEGLAQNDALVSQFELAGFDPGLSHMPVITLPVEARGAQPVGALIGADVLSHFDIDFDLGHNRAALYDPARCPGPLPDWTEPVTEVPLHVTWGRRLLLTVMVDGHPVRALLDSGASGSVIDLPAAERLGVTPQMLANEPGGEGFGAAGVNFQRVEHVFRSLELAGEREESPRIAVLDRSLQETDMLLGLDWLRRHHVWISGRRGVMYVARPVG